MQTSLIHHDAALDGDYFFTALDDFYDDQNLQNSTMKSNQQQQNLSDTRKQQMDLSNLSNITSYEFESKILKNNYKEYLLNGGGPQVTHGDATARSKTEMITNQQRHEFVKNSAMMQR